MHVIDDVCYSNQPFVSMHRGALCSGCGVFFLPVLFRPSCVLCCWVGGR